MVENDARLLRAVGGIIEHAAEHVGFAEDVKQELADATEEACRETFPLVANHGTHLKVVIEDFDDRIEVILDSTGKPLPKAALDSLAPRGSAAGSTRGGGPAALLARIDRVLYETKNGRPHIKLVKYIPGRAPKS